MRKIIYTAVIAFMFVLSGCAESTQHPVNETTNGIWHGKGIQAAVNDGTISIFFKTGEDESLYWKGTFPTTYTEGGYESAGDTDAMLNSLLGSPDETKTFMLKDGQIVFEAEAFGVVKEVKLRQNS